MSFPIKSPRKLIEVALPLEAINKAAVRESYIYKGNPSSIHKWWAQRPLAAARAIIFAQLVNDPGYQQGGGFKYGKNKKDAETERKRLFQIIEELIQWENNDNPRVLQAARAEILRSWAEECELNQDHPDSERLFNPLQLPGLHDPFAGGGTIPLEGQRLGLKPFASDLNPIPVLINKALLDIPLKFDGRVPVGPLDSNETAFEFAATKEYVGSSGLAEDVRRYAKVVRDEAFRKIGRYFPKVEITREMAIERPDLLPIVGKSFEVIAWIWARTAFSPNPAYSNIEVPLASTFILSSKPSKSAYVEPVLKKDHYSFIVKLGEPPNSAKNGTKFGSSGSDFRCIFSDSPMSFTYLRGEAKIGRMGQKLMAVVIDAPQGRTYLSPTAEMEELSATPNPDWTPNTLLPDKALGFRVQEYGMSKWSDLFTPRQLTALTTLCDEINAIKNKIVIDAVKGGLPDDGVSLDEGGQGALAYAESICTYLAFSVSKTSEYSNSLSVWYSLEDRPKGLFSKHAIPMVWDFPEQNPFGGIGGSFIKSSRIVADSIPSIFEGLSGVVTQANASVGAGSPSTPFCVSTDPPYYDNIGYADLSDFFYVWLRRSLAQIYPTLFSTITVPKQEELIATQHRHKSKEEAEQFFLDGMTKTMKILAERSHPSLPITIYYAFKQSEVGKKGAVSSTGWVTFLGAVINAGFQLTGTWPIRTERQSRSIGLGNNALASSIVLVCRKRQADAPVASRREFLRELNSVLPDALDEITKGSGDSRSPVAPVDLSQAIIGPGMAVFSKYSAVLEADGAPMAIRTALQIINHFLAEDDFDADTQFCLHWFEQFGWSNGQFGEADVLARAKATSVDGLALAGVVEAGGGSVRLLKWAEYPSDWDPRKDTRLPIWEALHHLIRTLKQGGETAAGAVSAAILGKLEAVRQLAYRLYTLCERQGWAEDARAYNELITSWSGIESAASNAQPAQRSLFDA